MRTIGLFVSAAFVATFALAQQDGGIKGAKQPGKVPTDVFNDRPKVEPKRGGELTEAVTVGFRSLDQDQDNSATTSEVANYICEALIGSDVETWEHIPALAERWETEDNVALHTGHVVLRKDGTKITGRLSYEKDGRVVVTPQQGDAQTFKPEDVDIRHDLVRGKVTETSDGCAVKTLKGEPVRTLKKEEYHEIRLGTSFTFHLRKDVVFHNGDPFTAKDVEWTIRLLRSPKNGMPNTQSYFEKIHDCTVIDDYTVRITYGEQYWMALNVCGGYIRVRPHKAWDPDGLLHKDEDAFFKTFNQHPLIMKPIGTGPYELDSFKKDVEVVLRRFDKWWGRTQPAPLNSQWPDKIRFRIIKDRVAQLAALKNGEVDLVTSIPPEQFDDFFGTDDKPKTDVREKFARVEIVYPSFGYYGFNMRKEIWKDKTVRRALAYACADNDKFVKDVLKGRAEMVCSAIYKYAPQYASHLKPIPYDPKKAEELLAEAGWFDSDGDGIIDKDGKKFEFEVLTREGQPTEPYLQHMLIMQQNLKKLGIKMEIRKLEWTAFLDKVDRGDFDVCRLGWALSSPPNTQDNYQIWHSSQIGESGSNHIAYANKRVDELLVAIRRELDPEKRRKMQVEFQEIIYDEQPYIFLWMSAELRAYSKKWRGVRFYVPRPCHSLNEWHQE